MIRNFVNFVVLVGFTLALPFFCTAAWGWGSEDERLLMKIAFCVLGPICADLWYVALWHLVLRRESSYLVQCLIFVFGYAGIFLMLSSGMVRF